MAGYGKRKEPSIMRLLFLLPALLFGILHAEEMRTWTDLQSRTIEARMLGRSGEAVMLQLKDGRKVTLAFDKLSASDVAYARSQTAAGQAAAAGTPAGTKTQVGAEAGEPNFAAAWPDRIKFGDDPEIVTVEENAEQKRFIYESTHYRYICDVRLSKSVVKGFAVMFEATHLFCRTLPIALDGGKTHDGKFQIQLFETLADYTKAGGPSGSAGVFIGSKATVLVPLTSLGVRPVGSGYMLDRDKSSKTLPHELTHQLTPNPYYSHGSIGWFTEGIAEYVAVTPYRSGAFSVRNNHNDIIAYTTQYGSKNTGGRALGKNIRLPDLKGFMLQDYSAFREQPQLNYGSSLLITYYFLQMDGDGDAKRIKAFLKALREGKKGEDALAVLLDGRSWEQLSKEISKAWSRRGVDLTFQASPAASTSALTTP